MPFCWFCHDAAHFTILYVLYNWLIRECLMLLQWYWNFFTTNLVQWTLFMTVKILYNDSWRCTKVLNHPEFAFMTTATQSNKATNTIVVKRVDCRTILIYWAGGAGPQADAFTSPSPCWISYSKSMIHQNWARYCGNRKTMKRSPGSATIKDHSPHLGPIGIVEKFEVTKLNAQVDW